MSDTEVKAIQRRRGTTAEHKTFKTGLEGEVTVNTTNHTVVVSDGKGNAFESARADLSNVNQINIIQHGIMDNSLTNFLINYSYDPEDGSLKITSKDSSTIISQLSNAMIADKEMKNVSLSAITDKGIARDTLRNVKVGALSWDTSTKDRIGGIESTDITGGGFTFRNLTNVDVTNFNTVPDKTGVGNGGLAWKNLSNISGVTLDTLKLNGICDTQLLNVEYDDLYGKDTVTTYGVEGAGKFLLRRDLDNVVTVKYDNLNRAGIARDDFYNVKYVETFDRDDEEDEADSEGFTGTKRITNSLQIAHKDLGNVDPKVLTGTNTNDRFKLMSYDGSNADKQKVFKGSKNFLMNTTFTSKRYRYNDTEETTQFGSLEDQGFSSWIVRRNITQFGEEVSNAEPVMYRNGEGVIFKGIFSQSIKNIGEQLAGKKVYFTCSDSSSSGIKVSLVADDKFDDPIISLTVDNKDENYSIYYCLFDLESADISEKLLNSKYVTLIIASKEESLLVHPQLELYSPTCWENRSADYEDRLYQASQKTIELVEFGSLPDPTGTYLKLESTYTSDDQNRNYYIEFDHEVTENDVKHVFEQYNNQVYLPSNYKVYIISNGIIEYYCESSKYQFIVDISSIETINRYHDYSLAYSTDDDRIHTYIDSKWRIIEDPIPSKSTLYYMRKDGVWYMYAFNTTIMALEEISISGGNASAQLPIFFHVKSDKRMNSASWVCADNFSELPAKVYSGAYEYLQNQVKPVGKIIPSGREVYNDATGNTEDLDSSLWLVEWSDNSYDTTTVLMSTGTAEDIKTWAETNGYTVSSYSSNIKEIELAKTLNKKTVGNISYYETFDGLKVVVANTVEESNTANENLRQLYETTGWAWYYFLGKAEDLDGQDFFKLPRARGLEVGGDVHSSKVGNRAGDRYDSGFEESLSGQPGTYMSTYFYVGTAVLKTEEIQVGKTLEVVNEINSKTKSVVVRGVNSYIGYGAYTGYYTIGSKSYQSDFASNTITEDLEFEIDEYNGHIDCLASFDFANIPDDKKTITTGYAYPIIIEFDDGTEESTTAIFTSITNAVDVQIRLDERFSTILIASAKQTTVNIDTSLLKLSGFNDVEFNVIVDKRSLTSDSGDIQNFNGSVTVKVNNTTVINNSSITSGEYNRFQVYSIPKYYDDYEVKYSFAAKKM